MTIGLRTHPNCFGTQVMNNPELEALYLRFADKKGLNMYEYQLVIGDYSGDGHGVTETVTFKVSHKAKDIKAAYKKAIRKAGISLDSCSVRNIEVVCNEYNNSCISSEQVEKLKSLGIKWDNMESEFNDDGSLFVSPEDLAYIFMEMVRSQLKTFKYKRVKPVCLNGFASDIGSIGYGCFI